LRAVVVVRALKVGRTFTTVYLEKHYNVFDFILLGFEHLIGESLGGSHANPFDNTQPQPWDRI
jgi:hypothetical protein